MPVTVGTFNLNNLFSRFNFQAEIDQDAGGDGQALQATYTFSDPTQVRIRRYRGRLVREKDAPGREHVARRLLGTHPDIEVHPPEVGVWAVQEVEDIDTLRFFARNDLAGAYPHVVLIEGNDPRLIDVAVLSKLPLGAVTSWQHAVHPSNPGERVFGRDLLEVEVLNSARTERLFTLFNTHLKSHFVPHDEDQEAGAAAANQRRLQQAETLAQIVAARTRPDSRYVITGDMNDPPSSPCLLPFVDSTELRLRDALADPVETRPARPDDPPPPGPAWTHRFKESGQPAEYELFDHIWLSEPLADRQDGAWIVRRRTHGGQGSDHDPATTIRRSRDSRSSRAATSVRPRNHARSPEVRRRRSVVASFVASNCDVRCLRLRTVNTLTCMDGQGGHGVAADGNSRNARLIQTRNSHGP